MFALLLILLQAPAPSPPAGSAPEPGPAAAAQESEKLPSVLEEVPLATRLAQPLRWGRIRVRERAISFSVHSARTATEDLDGVLVNPAQRAAALMALGCSKAPGVRAGLESWAVGGGSLERRAAILALGELGGDSAPFLMQLVDSEDPLIAETALFALLRLDSDVVRSQLEAIARDFSNPNSARTLAVMAFVDDPAHIPAPEAAKLLFELRWDAALRYGLVGGKSWSQLRVEELHRNPDFLRAVVLRSAVTLSLSGVDDHIVAMLDGGGPEVVRAAVQKIPKTLSQRLEAGEWQPQSDEEWEVMLDAIEEGGIRRETYPLAKAALAVPRFHLRAAGLMMAMGDEAAPEMLRDALYDPDLETRIRVCRSFGRSTDARWAKELAKLRREPEPRLNMAALVAQMRLGFQPADTVLRTIVLEGEKEQRELLVKELLEVSTDSRVPPLLEAAFPHLLGRLRLRVAADLALRGRVLPRDEILAALEAGVEPDLHPAFVRGLGRAAGQKELQALARLFPGDNLAINIELALALVRNHHALGISILTRALWSPPLDQSSLAGGLLVRARSVAVLQQELDSPPTPVTQNDIRRVGFALGEWGGVEALEDLAARRPSHDPALQGAYLGAMSARTQ